MFTAFDYPQYHHVALRAGAAGFVPKRVETRELIDAVRAAAGGELVFARRDDTPPPALKAREAEVVRLVADGRTNEEVGVAMGVTSKTVEAHLGRIFERTGVQSRTELATRAIREGWLDSVDELVDALPGGVSHRSARRRRYPWPMPIHIVASPSARPFGELVRAS